MPQNNQNTKSLLDICVTKTEEGAFFLGLPDGNNENRRFEIKTFNELVDYGVDAEELRNLETGRSYWGGITLKPYLEELPEMHEQPRVLAYFNKTRGNTSSIEELVDILGLHRSVVVKALVKLSKTNEIDFSSGQYGCLNRTADNSLIELKPKDMSRSQLIDFVNHSKRIALNKEVHFEPKNEGQRVRFETEPTIGQRLQSAISIAMSGAETAGCNMLIPLMWPRCKFTLREAENMTFTLLRNVLLAALPAMPHQPLEQAVLNAIQEHRSDE
ncbi:MAG: hypothetical protein MJK10_03955 [Pseudomonadales bacterium]|nr:hypothetical protein [Pseudomonadales bacterium]NRA15226.1 hypothetical protein [Oceanospirillaceae bacterium]